MVASRIGVHAGSGVFNKAFNILSQKPDWSVKKAFEIMLISNRDGYWQDRGPFNQSGFLEEAACGTVKATEKLGYSSEDVIEAFQKVGLILDNQC